MRANGKNSGVAHVLWVSLVLGVIAFLFFCLLSERIDFHPDEAIYFDAIPPNLSNDSGVLYHAYYSGFLKCWSGPVGARFASALLGGATVSFLAYYFLMSSVGLIGVVLLMFAMLFSYQSIFVFDRVRPEAMWWMLVSVTPIVLHRNDWGRGGVIAFAVLIFLLPLNHRLAWFPALFLLGYAFLFVRSKIGFWKFCIFPLAFALGIVFNITFRAWWLDRSVSEAFAIAFQSPGIKGQHFGDFWHLVFRDAPNALNDAAENVNLFRAMRRNDIYWASHAYIQNSIWIVMFLLPLFGRTWRERYILAAPLLAFICFFLSGYYNPTYAAGFSMLCVLMLVWIFLKICCFVRWLALAVVALSIINGLSFVGTRIVNHGAATYFDTYSKLRTMLESVAGDSVALPERYQIVASGVNIKRRINFKDVNVSGVDYFVFDNYDELMYGFVPDFEVRKMELKSLRERMCMVASLDEPVYKRDKLFPVSDDGTGGHISRPGSWFFRNSVTTTLYIYKKC